MPKVRPSSFDPNFLQFKCPGCEDDHYVRIGPPANPEYHATGRWTFNGNLDRPTFSPSLLVTAGHYTWKDGKDPKECLWCNDDNAPFGCYICHSFINDGNIQFLNDCTHKLAGQTVPLLEIENGT